MTCSTKTDELADIITAKSAEIAARCGSDICKWGYKPRILKAFRCMVTGAEGTSIIHAMTAGKARYKFLSDLRDIYDDIGFQHIGVRRAPDLDMKFPILPAVAAKLNEEDKELIIHAFGGGSHIKPEHWGYRDHYCCQPNDEMLTKLVSLGLFRGPCGVDAKGVMPG